MVEGIERYAKNSCKDLLQLMQINKKFILRICSVLSKIITQESSSAE